MIKPDVVVRWTSVPQSYIFTTNTFRPGFINACLGKVNENEFLGFLEGTLLLVGVKLTRYPWALKPRAGLPGADQESEFLYDVEFLMSYFDPFKGFAGNPPVEIVANRGHNNFPYRGVVGGPATDPNAGLWFYASLNGGLGFADRPLYEYLDFKYLFDCPQNPP